jgi:hypothetical protein
MPSYKTLAQILIATSAVGSALAAPALAQEMHDTRTDPSQLDRRINKDIKNIFLTAIPAGLVAGTLGAFAAYDQRLINAQVSGSQHK